MVNVICFEGYTVSFFLVELPHVFVTQVSLKREHRRRSCLLKHCQSDQEEFLVPHEQERNVARQIATLQLTVNALWGY